MSNFVVAADHVNDNADLGAAVDVCGELAFTFNDLEAADGDVFTDLADQAFTNFVNGRAVERKSGKSSNVSRFVFGDELGDIVGESDEVGILSNEVGFGVQFNDSADLARFVDVDSDNAVSGNTASSLSGLVAELNAKNFFSLLHVAVCFCQSLFAFHHRSVGFNTKFFNHCGSDNSHCFILKK